jgi:hypothetical protein
MWARRSSRAGRAWCCRSMRRCCPGSRRWRPTRPGQAVVILTLRSRQRNRLRRGRGPARWHRLRRVPRAPTTRAGGAPGRRRARPRPWRRRSRRRARRSHRGRPRPDLRPRTGRGAAPHGRVDVVLTREADVFVPLPTRVTLARAAGADALISIHADAVAEGRARGATVYTLSDTASDAASAALAEQHDRADMCRGSTCRPRTTWWRAC